MANPKELDRAVSEYLLGKAAPHFAKAAESAQSGNQAEVEKEAETAKSILDQAKGFQRFWVQLTDDLNGLGVEIPTLRELFTPPEQPAPFAPEVPLKAKPDETVLGVPTPELPKPAKIVLISRGNREIEVDGERIKSTLQATTIWPLLNFFAWINNPERVYGTAELNDIAKAVGSNAKHNPGTVVFNHLKDSLENRTKKTTPTLTRSGTSRNAQYRINAEFEGFLPEDNPEFADLKDLHLTSTELKLLQPLLKTRPDLPFLPYIAAEYLYEEKTPEDRASLAKKIHRIYTEIIRLRPKLEEKGITIVKVGRGAKSGGFYLEKREVLTAPAVPEPTGAPAATALTKEEIRQRQEAEKLQQEAQRVLALRERINPERLYKPLKGYFNVLENPEVATFLAETPDPARRLFEDLLRDPGSQSRILNAVVEHSGRDAFRRGKSNRLFQAATFEETARMHVIRESKPGNIVLSAEDVAIALKNIYHPDKDLTTGDSFGLNYMIEGVNMTDGWVINPTDKQNLLITVLEAKLYGKEEKDPDPQLLSQRQGYYPEALEASLRLKNHQGVTPEYIGRLLHAINPNLPAYPLAVDPNLIPLYLIPEKSGFHLEGVSIKEVPVTTKDISSFAQVLKRVKFS